MSITNTQLNQAIVLMINEKIINKDVVREIRNELKKTISDDIKHILWNLENCTGIQNDVFDDLKDIADEINAKNLRFVIFTNNTILHLVEEKGYQSFIPVFVSPNLSNSKKLNSNIDLMKIIADSVIQTLKELSEENFTYEKIEVKKVATKPATSDVVGVIGLTSLSFRGALVLSFDAEIILKLASRILAEDFTELNQEVAGWSGEILNMSMGKVKGIVNAQGEKLTFSIPNSFVGNEVCLVENQAPQGNIYDTKFSSNLGSFNLRFTIEELIYNGEK